MKRNRANANADGSGGFGGHGYGQHGSGYPPGPPGGQPYPPQPQYQGSSAYGYDHGTVGGAPGWQHRQFQGNPMTHQQQQQQQPQFRGQWNDYDNASQQRNGASNYRHHNQHAGHASTQSQEMTNYSQTQPSQLYGGSQYGSSQVVDHPNMDPPQPRKRQRATKRRVRQPLSGPAGIWFRMNKKASSASSTASAATGKDTKEGVVKTGDDAFGFEEAAVVAHQAHHVMTDRNRKERERREEEEMKGSADDAEDVDMLYDEKTGQNEKVPDGTTSTYEATLGRAWDIMCMSMDRIVPEPSVYLHNHQRQPYHEIRAALDSSPCGKLRHFSLLSEIMGRDGPNRDIGIPGSGGRLRVGHLAVSIASVHNNNHCDWTVELRDETVTNSSSSSSSTPGGRDVSVSGGEDDQDAGASKGANSIMGWVEEDLLKDHPDWIRPGVVLYLRDAACTVFEAVSAGAEDDVGGSSGAPGGGGSSLISSGNGLDRMLLISESSVVCVWTPESHMDREDFLNLIERRNMARDHIKEEVTDLTQNDDQEPNGKGVVFKASPPSLQMDSTVHAHPKPSHVEIYGAEKQKVKSSSTQEGGENTAIDLTSGDIGDKENQEENDAFITENTKSLDGANLESLPADVGQNYSGAGTSSLPTSDRDPHQKQQNEEGLLQEHGVTDGTARSALSNPYARAPSAVQEAPKQNDVVTSQECCVNIAQDAVKSSAFATVDDEIVLNGDSTNDTEATGEPSQQHSQGESPTLAISNPYQKDSSETTSHVLMPNNTAQDAASDGTGDLAISSKADPSPSKEGEKGPMGKDAKKNESPPKQNSEAKTSTQTTAASSIWDTAGTDDGGEETGVDYDVFSAGLSSTQDESLSPMVPSKGASSSAAPQKPPTEDSEAPRSAKKANREKRAGASGIFSGACEDMFDDLGEEDDDDDF